MKGCGILVCTVNTLNRLLNFEIDQKLKLFDKSRIRHLIIDDIDIIVGRFSSELQFVTETFFRDLNDESDLQVCVA